MLNNLIFVSKKGCDLYSRAMNFIAHSWPVIIYSSSLVTTMSTLSATPVLPGPWGPVCAIHPHNESEHFQSVIDLYKYTYSAWRNIYLHAHKSTYANNK